MATSSTCSSAIARSSATTRRCWRRRRRRTSIAKSAPSCIDRAVALARAINYDNLGTVEFILEEGEDDPWFLEMNTRLQVEHPVTEAITGFDLVEWQIRIASGERLPAAQDQIRESGHAIEARITAERADQGFRPDAGRIVGYREPATIRIDSGVAAGSEVTLFYDSLLAKAIAAGATREGARAKFVAGLRDFAIFGPATTIPFLIDALENPIFVAGKATTRFIDDAFPKGWTPARSARPLARAAAALLRWTRLAGRAHALRVDAAQRAFAFSGRPEALRRRGWLLARATRHRASPCRRGRMGRRRVSTRRARSRSRCASTVGMLRWKRRTASCAGCSIARRGACA